MENHTEIYKKIESIEDGLDILKDAETNNFFNLQKQIDDIKEKLKQIEMNDSHD